MPYVSHQLFGVFNSTQRWVDRWRKIPQSVFDSISLNHKQREESACDLSHLILSKRKRQTSITWPLIAAWSGTLGDNRVPTALSADDGQTRVHHLMTDGPVAAVMSLLGIVLSAHNHTKHIQPSPLRLNFQGHIRRSPNLKSPSSIHFFESLR